MRRIGLATWDSPGDPSVYGTLTLRMERVLEYINGYREKKRKPLTIQHLLIKGVGMVLNDVPDSNSIIRYQRIYHKKSIGIFSQVFLKDHKTGEFDLSGLTIYDPHNKTFEDIIEEFSVGVKKIKKGTDENFDQTRNMFRWLPFFLAKPLLNLTAFLNYTFNLNLKMFGVPKDAFGSVMITNIASLGLEQAYVPLVPYSRVPLLLTVGPVIDQPVVEEGNIKVGKTMQLHVTFDHRLLDGSHLARMSASLNKYFSDPYEYFGAIDIQD